MYALWAIPYAQCSLPLIDSLRPVPADLPQLYMVRFPEAPGLGYLGEHHLMYIYEYSSLFDSQHLIYAPSGIMTPKH